MISLQRDRKLTIAALIWITCVKILCIPSYRSTDFDVHRNWLAITRHLPISEWYFDNVNGTTVHTLDYPPTFAYFEYFLSNNPLTNWLLNTHLLDERCLALLSDSNNEPSPRCVVFHRLTVILSDLILWGGAAIACDEQGFLFTILNPGLLWLDHVHFQYNGAMLGILLASLGLLVRGHRQEGIKYHCYHLGGALLYALLVTMKHLYLPLAPLYFIYLLSNYCFQGNQFSLRNFVSVACLTGTTLILPFAPFLVQDQPMNQMLQIASRLFPFGRGLVHDYWAGNFWALYMLVGKVVTKVLGIPLPDVPPAVCAMCLFFGLLPGLVIAWKCTPRTFLQCVVFCSLSSFMVAYHVHEKAIMTAIIPLAMLIQHEPEKRLYLRINALGLVGLFPLLFRPVELPLKLLSYTGYMAFVYYGLDEPAIQLLDLLGVATVGILVVFVEFVHPLCIYPRMEFLPLLLTSVICAVGLICCWGDTCCLIFQSQIKKRTS
jgi:alpha-1,3-glucosyltransferase